MHIYLHRCQPSRNRAGNPAIVREIPHFYLFPAFPHFSEDVPHFLLYFERKIPENRDNSLHRKDFVCVNIPLFTIFWEPTHSGPILSTKSSEMYVLSEPVSNKIMASATPHLPCTDTRAVCRKTCVVIPDTEFTLETLPLTCDTQGLDMGVTVLDMGVTVLGRILVELTLSQCGTLFRFGPHNNA